MKAEASANASSDSSATARGDTPSPDVSASVFLNTFMPSYQRNNKRYCIKNLRCFPHCLPAHRDSGFCGADVRLLIPLPHKNDEEEEVFYAAAKFRLKTSETPALGTKFTVFDMASRTRTKAQPTLSWIDPHVCSRLSKLSGDFDSYASAAAGREDGVLVSFSKRGWHYSWLSNKHATENFHVMTVFLMKRVGRGATKAPASTVKILGGVLPEDTMYEDVFELVGIFDSPTFTIHCRRRSRDPGPAITANGVKRPAPPVVSGPPPQPAIPQAAHRLSFAEVSDEHDRPKKKKRGRPPSSPRTVPKPAVKCLSELLLCFDDNFCAITPLKIVAAKIDAFFKCAIPPDEHFKFSPRFSNGFLKNRNALCVELANASYASSEFRDTVTSWNVCEYSSSRVDDLIKLILDQVEIFLFDVNASRAEFRRVFNTPSLEPKTVYCTPQLLGQTLIMQRQRELAVLQELLRENAALEQYAASSAAAADSRASDPALEKASSTLKAVLGADDFVEFGQGAAFFRAAARALDRRRQTLEQRVEIVLRDGLRRSSM